jgi:Zn finger protein HypA/HybF involved in hydrogenase expression
MIKCRDCGRYFVQKKKEKRCKTCAEEYMVIGQALVNKYKFIREVLAST